MSDGTSGIPPVHPLVLAEALDALPSGLRRRLDRTVAQAAQWEVAATGDGVVVRVSADTTVTLATDAGVVRQGDAARCSCLLAPRCLHRAAVLAAAPVADEEPTGTETAERRSDGTSEHAPEKSTDGPSESLSRSASDDASTPPQLTAQQVDAAHTLWEAAVAVLEAGSAGCGVVGEAVLQRAAHGARVHGLHRAAAAARRTAAQLRAARERSDRFDRRALTDDLREVLAVTHGLRKATAAVDLPDLVGRARRGYDVAGSLRLYGLFRTPLVTDDGYAGVVTYLVDRDARLWTLTDLLPGGPERVAAAADGPIRLGGSSLSHRDVSRAGVVVSGATASPERRLGSGRGGRAVRAAGVPWHEPPLATLWEQPLRAQTDRAFTALAEPPDRRAAGADLVFLRVTVLAPAPGPSLVVAHPDGVLLLTAPDGPTSTTFAANLALLAPAVGTDLLVIARPDPTRRATVHALAIAPVPESADDPVASPPLRLPESLGGHADLGLDHLHTSHLPAPPASPAPPGTPRPSSPPPHHRPALWLLRSRLERTVAGGRAVHSLGPADPDVRRLTADRFATGARLLTALDTAARNRPRDAFGRLTPDGGAPFAVAWLTAAVYEEAASRALAAASWLPPGEGN